MEVVVGDWFVEIGRNSLLQGNFETSQWCFDTILYENNSRFAREVRDPSLWQRGLSSYYAGQFEEGKLQFACDMEENRSDVEEIIWHFLCQCRRTSLAEAALKDLVQPGAPPIQPMSDVLELFKGKSSSEAVIQAASPSVESETGSPIMVKSYNDTNALAYAHFYVGLYEEIHGRYEVARQHFLTASSFDNPDYMGSVMKMHAHLFLRRYPPWYDSVHPAKHLFPKIIHGGWQLSRGHQVLAPEKCVPQTVRDLLEVYDAGTHAFDCGDIYTGVEELYGMLIKAHCARGGTRSEISIHTKFVPDLEAIRSHAVDRNYIKSVLRRSLNRLGVQYLDLVQFHWWDTAESGSLEALKSLSYFVSKGWIKRIGLTNFDTSATKLFLDSNIPIVSTQVQFSLLDRRPLNSGLIQLCAAHEISVLAYGVLAGGFLTDKWLGREQPKVEDLENRSLVKYIMIIEEFGGWTLYQQLLRVLRGIADRHGSVQSPLSGEKLVVSVAMVAISYILEQDQVSSVITGAHNNKYLDSVLCACTMKLSRTDMADINSVLKLSEGPGGSVYELERGSRHGAIMKYNLNQINSGPHMEELCLRYLRLHFEGHPVEATRTGFRHIIPATFNLELPETVTKEGDISFRFDYAKTGLACLRAINYDHLYGPCSEAAIQEYCRKVQFVLEEVEGINTSILSPDQLVDHELIISNLNLELLQWREIQWYKKDPLFYLPLNSILYVLPFWGPEGLLPKFKSHPGTATMSTIEKLIALLSRLRNIPNALIQAQRNLTKPVCAFVETAIEICDPFASFLVNDLPSSLRAFEGDSQFTVLIKDVTSAAMMAKNCIVNYKSFLKDHLLPVSSPLSGIGKELYEKILKWSHFIESSNELLAFGEKQFSLVKKELELISAEMEPTKTWKEITEDVIQQMHPTAANLLDAYMLEIERCRSHMIDQDLVTALPEGEKIVGFWTPKFLTPFSPVGDYLNPSPFAGMGPGKNSSLSRVGHLMIHSVEDRNLSSEEEEKILRGHDYSWISVVCPHESYPGHHVQALHAQSHPRVLRQYHESTIFYEGWGLYTEQLAYETGFFEKELTYATKDMSSAMLTSDKFAMYTRLTQLRLQLWRCARIILDVKLNTGKLSADECKEFLQREVMFNAGAVKGEVFMYVSRPGYASCYMAGFMQIMELREAAKKKQGKNFNLKEFHDTLLGKGCIPFKLLSILTNL